MQLFQSLEEDNKNSELSKRLLYLLLCFCLIQGYLNFARIASQATTGPFGRYKSNTGIRSQLTDELGYTNKKVSNYNAQDVFNLQFGHYSPFLDYVKERKDEDGILIAGTYSQYFIKNQKNIYFDGLLNSLWEDLSDYNSCKSYHRLQNKHVKYIVIDPNIGTIGRVGAGNESLFHRFFAKLNADESEILTPGGITMLTKLLQEGYLKLIYTNNL